MFDVEVIRAIERLVVVCFGGMSVFLGWLLFKYGVVTDQKGVFEGKGIKISLERVGPGIFFSLFGSVILVTSLLNGISVKEQKTDAKANNETVREVSFLGTIDQNPIETLILDINTLKLITQNTALYENHRTAIKLAIDKLNIYRDILLRKKFGIKMQEYENCKKSMGAACLESETFKDIVKWETDTLL